MDLLFITLGPKSLKLLYSIMNLNTISLPCLAAYKSGRENLKCPLRSLVHKYVQWG